MVDSQNQQRRAEQAAAVAAAAAVYGQQTTTIRANLTAYITRLWASLGAYRSSQAFTRQAIPVITGAQTQMAAITAAYLARQQQIGAGGNAIPAPVSVRDVTGAASRNGTSLTDVYERPFHTVWRRLDELPREPGSIDKAIQSGLDQALTEAKTDLQRTKTLTAQQVLAKDRRHIAGYRRILEGPYSCGLCIVASTLRYHIGTLMPIHPGCDCGVLPIYGDTDPGPTINEQRLGQIHDAIAAQFGKSAADARLIRGQVLANGQPMLYRDVVVTHDHGELGPIMGIRGRDFTTPADLK